MNTEVKNARQIILWLLIFVYFTFAYNYGAKLSTLIYTDFPSFYYGAKLTFSEKQSPYDAAALSKAAFADEPVKAGEAPPTIYPYLYPPPSLLMFYPMARLHIGAARVGLLVLNHLCLLAMIAMLLMPIAGFKPRELLTLLPAFLIIYMLFSKGVFNTIELGQVNLIVLALLCLAWWGIKKDWPPLAIAVPLGMAAVFKIYPVLFLAILVFRRKYLAAVLTIGVLLLFCGIAWFIVPRPLWHQWAFEVLPHSGYLKNPGGVFPPTISQNIGIAGFTARLFLPLELFKGHPLGPALIPHQEKIGTLLTYALVGLAGLITVAAAFISSTRPITSQVDRDRRINLEFSLFLILTFLVAPLAWEHHLAYVMPAAVMALVVILRDRPESKCAWTPTLLLLIACVIGWPLTIGKLPLPRVPQVLAVSLKLYAVIVLWIFLLKQILAKPIPTENTAQAHDNPVTS